MGTTSVTFSEPGDYVLLVQSIETLRNSFEYHCCWTNGMGRSHRHRVTRSLQMNRMKDRQNIRVALAGCRFRCDGGVATVRRRAGSNLRRRHCTHRSGNCVRCHRAGTAAPMVLETYEQVRAFAPLIKHSVQTRTMPPGWYIDRTLGIQDFKNNPSLSDQEIETIASWVDSGMAAGDLSQLPAPVVWQADHEYWQLEQDQGWGPPDMIITSPPFTVPANSGDQWWEPDAAST